LPDHGKAIDIERDQSSFIEFGCDGLRRNKCNA
jgi:hypothetical protein